MKIERTKNATRNIAVGTFYKVVSLVFPFIIRTILLKVLGEEYLGLSSLFTSVLQVFSLSELGFGSAIVFSMYKSIASDDDKEICALLNLYRTFYRIVGIVIAVIGLINLPFVPRLITGTFPLDVSVYWVYLIYLFNTVISYFLYGYKSSLLSAYQRTDVENAISTVTVSIMYALQIILLFAFKNYYLYVVCYPVVTMANNIIRAKVTKKMYPHYFCTGKLGKEKLLEIKKLVLALIGHKIGGVVVNSTDNIVISVFLGLSSVAIYNNYYYIFNAISGLISIIYSAMIAGIGNSIAIETKEKNYNDFNKFSFMNAWIIIVCCTCFASLYQPFMQIWVGSKFMFNYDMVILFVIYFFVLHIRYIVLTYKDACGMWQQDILKPFVESAVNLIVNIVLIQYIGIEGVIISTIISLGFIALPWETHVLFKHYFEREKTIYYIRLFKYVGTCVGSCAIAYFICNLLPDFGIGVFVLKGIIAFAVSNVLILIIFRSTNTFKESCDFWKVPILKKLNK